MHPVTAQAVRAMLADGEELALIDVREELIYSQNHLLWARSVPLSRLELRFARLVPRLSTRIVLIDDADGLAQRAADVLSHAGYDNLSYLDGGVAAWAAAGFELFSGVHVPSKAFGEYIEHACDTPNISAEELNRLIESRADMVVLDSRPFDEYQRVSIPTSTNVPGAELVLRVRDMAPSPDTLVVVNCAGRTRSIIGAQSLINAGVPNKVVALRNGTMGFTLAGFSCERGKRNRPLRLSSESKAWAKEAATRVAQRYGIESIDLATLDRWHDDKSRTLYVLDVRDPELYGWQHVFGAISAPGGQLVQATDLYVGTLGARLVLVDDDGVQAVMTASWLKQMGWKDVFTLQPQHDMRQDVSGLSNDVVLAPYPPPEFVIECDELSARLRRSEATVVDLSLSPNYRKGHIPGAWFAIRSRLAAALPKIPVQGELVLTSEDGDLAAIAVAEAAALANAPVRFLLGGNKAWTKAKLPLSTEPQMADDPVDVWLKPYERTGDTTGAMNEYLSWEVDLVRRIERDGTCHFTTRPAGGSA
jgi:rhodanese-related sulfurtransferase